MTKIKTKDLIIPIFTGTIGIGIAETFFYLLTRDKDRDTFVATNEIIALIVGIIIIFLSLALFMAMVDDINEQKKKKK